MLAEKTTAILNTGAEACTACDNSCLMHIHGALHRQTNRRRRTVHLAEILASTEEDRSMSLHTLGIPFLREPEPLRNTLRSIRERRRCFQLPLVNFWATRNCARMCVTLRT